MSSKKRVSKKKEVLPDPSKISDGKFNYYIRGWSSYTSIKNLTRISHELVESCTGANREVGPIPKTNVLILPTDGNENSGKEDLEGSLTVELELADQLRVEGITKKLVKEKAALIRSWKPVDPAQEPPPPESQPPSDEVKNKEVKNANESDTGMNPEILENTAQVPEDVSNNPIDDAIINTPPLPEIDAEQIFAERLLAELQEIEVEYGAQFGTLDNLIMGDLHIMGVEPSIVVHPDIVVEVAEKENKTIKKSSKIKSNVDKGKKNKKKLNPEQLAELERQEAEEQALRERQVQEAIERSRRKEEYLKTFSHPDRWAHITITGLTFTGKIRVSRAHVTFQNCRFMGQLSREDTDEPQLSVYPYSVVHLTKCTFEMPSNCGLYAFPFSQVSLKKCLFSGLSQQELASVEYKDRLGNTKDLQNLDNVEASSSKSNEKIKNFTGNLSRDIETAEQPLSEELVIKYNALRKSNALLVGVQVDSARISIEDCRFIFLGIGVLFCGRCVFSEFPQLPSIGDEFKSHAAMTMKNSQLHHMYGTAVVIAAFDVLLKNNKIHDCEYYGVDCYAKFFNVSVLRNYFGIYAVVRIRKGMRIKLLNNTLHEPLVDDNIYNNPCLDSVY
ncbi:unnamed protein product [Phytomonas sp. Hart1]|nr:unnamed protein product [Phytomonas sp. Hart1]|eukprot:CCW66489.1 unnamed protein product [Phytomonas sp. isolate Hart1]